MSDMATVKAQLAAFGVNISNLNEEQLIAVARALKVKAPRKVEVVEYTSKGGRTGLYVKTETFPYEGDDGKEHAARNLFVPAVPEVLQQMVEDLQQGLKLLKSGK